MSEALNSPCDLYNKAIELIEGNNLTEAYEKLRLVLLISEEDVDVLNLSGFCKYFLCDFNSANIFWTKSMLINKENNRALNYLEELNSQAFKELIVKYNQSIDEISKNNLGKAISLIEEIAAKEPELVEPYILLGLSYYEAKNKERAKYYFLKAQNLDKGNERINRYILSCEEKTKASTGKKYLAAAVVALIIAAAASSIAIARTSVLKALNTKLSNSEQKAAVYLSQKDQVAEENSKLIKQMEALKISNNAVKASNENIVVLKAEDENGAFRNAFSSYKDGNYEEAIKGFLLIMSQGTDKSLVAEATYFAGKSYEILNQDDKAMDLYSRYINNFKACNYYDESLYYYGILLYKTDSKDKAKEIFSTLIKEVPNSIYVNSKVKYMLKN